MPAADSNSTCPSLSDASSRLRPPATSRSWSRQNICSKNSRVAPSSAASRKSSGSLPSSSGLRSDLAPRARWNASVAPPAPPRPTSSRPPRRRSETSWTKLSGVFSFMPNSSSDTAVRTVDLPASLGPTIT